MNDWKWRRWGSTLWLATACVPWCEGLSDAVADRDTVLRDGGDGARSDMRDASRDANVYKI